MDIQDILVKLTDISRDWASGKKFDTSKAGELRREAIRLNHRHYLETLPLYRKLADEEGCDGETDIDTMKNKLMLSADIFKSYRQSWLDDNDYAAMTRWLAGLFHREIEVDTTGVTAIDGWIDRLGAAGVHVVYSSGTSGAFSFVPREKEDWQRASHFNTSYLTPLLAPKILGNSVKGKLAGSALRLIPADRLSGLAGGNQLADFDAVFLGFRGGRMGNQALITELAPRFGRVSYLYDIEITGSALRALTREARTDEERKAVKALQDEAIGRREENYRRITESLNASAETGRKVFIFGAPYQFKELCEFLSENRLHPAPGKGSLALFGGGWKSFAGEAIDRNSLVEIMAASLNLPEDMILEGYSMTESNVLTVRCGHGRFHIPPLIEPVIFDEELNPVEGDDIRGIYGFLDPMAVSYPGFLITNDVVRLVNGTCPCGLSGYAVTEIGRLAGSEVKGCGGIMSSMQV